ncbi:MAG: nucleotide-binding universal stress UspA family protein [Candidatus Azotimanducaceae bacterium]|jgi:nucleotide-binding universal stress UspA family protein
MTSVSPKILVPIGFSEKSLIALQQATNLAKAMRGELILLSVFEESGTLRKFFKDNEQQFQLLKKSMKLDLEDISKEVVANAVPTTMVIRKGKVYEEIVAAADELSASFIFMGTDGKPGQSIKKHIGSNTYRVMTSAHCPVITIKGSVHREGCKIIVLPLDLMKETKEKVGHACKLAKLFGAEIHVISVLDTSDAFKKNKLTRNLKQVERFIAKEKQLPVVAKTIKPMKGVSVSETIVKYAHDNNADLITIMTQQEDYLTRHFLGSAAQEIVFTSATPVMSIRPKPKKDTAVFDLP